MWGPNFRSSVKDPSQAVVLHFAVTSVPVLLMACSVWSLICPPTVVFSVQTWSCASRFQKCYQTMVYGCWLWWESEMQNFQCHWTYLFFIWPWGRIGNETITGKLASWNVPMQLPNFCSRDRNVVVLRKWLFSSHTVCYHLSRTCLGFGGWVRVFLPWPCHKQNRSCSMSVKDGWRVIESEI